MFFEIFQKRSPIDAELAADRRRSTPIDADRRRYSRQSTTPKPHSKPSKIPIKTPDWTKTTTLSNRG